MMYLKVVLGFLLLLLSACSPGSGLVSGKVTVTAQAYQINPPTETVVVDGTTVPRIEMTETPIPQSAEVKPTGTPVPERVAGSSAIVVTTDPTVDCKLRDGILVSMDQGEGSCVNAFTDSKSRTLSVFNGEGRCVYFLRLFNGRKEVALPTRVRCLPAGSNVVQKADFSIVNQLNGVEKKLIGPDGKIG